MPTMYDADPQDLITKAKEELKKIPEIKPPEWAAFVKTGMHKERPPVDGDWWYIRTASVLRSVYRLGPVGVSKLRTKYGGKKNRGHKKEHTYKGSGSILRKALQQLEKAGLVKQTEIKKHKGRVVTAKGRSFMDKLASQIVISAPKKAEETPEVREHPKKTKPEAKVEHKGQEAKTEAKKEHPKKEAKKEPKPEAKVEHKKPEAKKESTEAKKEQLKKESKSDSPKKEETPQKEPKPEAKSEVSEEQPKKESKSDSPKKEETPHKE
jgi:small subunit ribosomal protein S19e